MNWLDRGVTRTFGVMVRFRLQTSRGRKQGEIRAGIDLKGYSSLSTNNQGACYERPGEWYKRLRARQAAQQAMASPGGTAGLERVLHDDLLFRILNFLTVAELHHVSVNQKLLRIFRDPQLWKEQVETLLPVLAPDARRYIEQCLNGGGHLWSQQLQYDYDWQTLLGLLQDTDALQLANYMCDHAYIYREMASFEMVSVRVNGLGQTILIMIPFLQTTTRRFQKVCDRGLHASRAAGRHGGRAAQADLLCFFRR
jgi:hypothetical protein